MQGQAKHRQSGLWRTALWGELATLEYGKSLRDFDISTGLYRVYGTNGPIGWHSEPLCPYASVIIGRKGAYRGVHYSPEPFCVIDTAFYLNPKVELDTRWAYYQLLTQNINGLDSGSAIPSTSRQDFYGLPVDVPPLPEQQAIARVLGALDDKIELNRRMNETLEEMARALFKSWLVDFEPVRAKMEGRWRRGESLPGLPAGLFDLFPGRLVESELGQVPEGWGVVRLGNLLETLETGYRPSGGVAGILTGVPSVGAESIERIGVFDFSKTKYVPLDFYRGMKRGVVEEGDVLIYKDGGRPGELEPAVTYVSRGFPFSAFCINEHVYRVRTVRFSQHLLYCYLTTSSAFWQMRELATGVAQPGLNRQAIESITITIPHGDRVLRACQERIGPLLDECNVNSLESQHLSQIRDVLLPALVSGEVGVFGNDLRPTEGAP